MKSPSELFDNVNEVVEVVEETIEGKQELEEEISQSVSLIDGAFKNIQEQILNSNRKELSSYKAQVIEVYNICNDIIDNQLPKYKKEVIQSDLRVETRVNQLRKELLETLEERISETKETIKVFFREEIKDVNKLRASVLAVEEYIKKTPNTIFELREQVFEELRKNTEVSHKLIEEKLDKIGTEYELIQEGLLNEPPSTQNTDSLTPLDQNFVTIDQLNDHYRLFVNRVQQQLSTIGGGGEVRFEFLDDVDRASVKVQGTAVAWDSTTGKFIGTTSIGLATESQTLNNVLALGNVSGIGMSVGVTTTTKLHVGVDTGFFTEDLVVNGDARVTGIFTVGRDTIVLDGINNTMKFGGTTVHQDSATGDTILMKDGAYNPFRASRFLIDADIVIDSNRNINAGIITGTSFLQNGVGLVTFTKLSQLTNDSGYITTSFTNTNQLTNSAGFVTSIVSGDFEVTGNVSIGGTLTYEDVKNVDSIGLITARSGIQVTGHSELDDVNVSGILTTSNLNVGVAATNDLLIQGSSSVSGIGSTTYANFVTDCSQGYYAYTTDYYTVGTANTVQELEEDTWNLLQPQVAAQYNHQTHQMQEANGGSPWIGAGATVGTGQTTFSLAGMGDGANCLVRIAFRFTPDVDDSDMDVRLRFTTNTATQGTGLTNFSITKQALVITQGADEEYPGEILIPFFVGSTLSGISTTDAGKFSIEANPSDEGELEMLAVTVMVDN